MVIYECDMCGKHFGRESDVQQIDVHGKQEDYGLFLRKNIDHLMICEACSREVGEFIRGYKSRMSGLNCTIDTKFGGSGGKA